MKNPIRKMCDGAVLCSTQVVVCLSEELLSQAVMMVERCRPTLTINLGGARQHWLEGMLRHEIGAFPIGNWHLKKKKPQINLARCTIQVSVLTAATRVRSYPSVLGCVSSLSISLSTSFYNKP